MVGNDIVDLKQAELESNWQRKGFLNKVFTEEEQALILNANNSFKMVWRLWSMKESAYKIYVQHHNYRFFNLLKLKCELLSKTVGIVTVNNEKYYTKSRITENYIYTVATLKDKITLLDNCFRIERNEYVNQHQKTYSQLKLEVSKKWNIPVCELNIQKNLIDIPSLFQFDKPLNILFSLSHHGNYGSFSILK